MLKKIIIFFNILTFCKAFYCIPEFLNLGYQVEITEIFKNFQSLLRPTSIKCMHTKKINYNVEILFKTRKCCPTPPHNIILFELDSDVKFPLLRLIQFLSDLKGTILRIK